MERTPLTLARTSVPLVLVILLAFVAAPPASAEETTCTGAIGTETHDNIRVPDGASCTLQGTTAEGSVYVGTGSTLHANDVNVIGNIQAEGADDVVVTASQVGGSVQLKQGGGARVTISAITADLQLETNNAPLEAEGNDIGGNLQAFQNSGGVVITDNVIDGNLQCRENNPAPTGGGNVVHGSAEDQCAHMAVGGSPDPSPTTDPAPAARESGRLAGPDRFATAVAISQAAFPQGAAVAYLARADEFADALAAGSLTDGPILLVPSCGEVPQVVADEIRRLDPARVVALGGTVAVGDAVLNAAVAA